MSLIVDISPQSSCVITPIHPTTLRPAGGSLRSGTTNVTMSCSCNGKNDVIRWFSPNGNRLRAILRKAKGTSNTVSNQVSILHIPIFNYSYAGTYACGYGYSFPPTAVVLTNLSK